MSMLRSKLATLGLSAILVVLGSCGTAASDSAHSGATLDRAFQASARRWNVPEPVLRGIGWEQTRWFHPAEPSLIGGWGVMGLVEGDGLEKAAELTGHELERLKRDPVANIDGGAAVLASLADWYFAEYPTRDRDRLADWFEVTKHTSGVTDAEMAEVFAVGVYRAIALGADRLFEDGVSLRLDPTEVDVGDELIYQSATQYLTPDYPNAIWRPSPNFSSRGGTSIQKVVIHTCQGGYSGCVSWLRNTAASASAHYVISKGGEISQLVENKNKAWHARCHNPETIGIEHEGFVSDSQNYTEAMYRASAGLVRFICDTYGIPKDAAHIIGHSDASIRDCNTHTDPGSYWNWSYFIGLVNGGGSASTGTLKGAVFWGSNFDTDKSDTAKRLVGATVTTNTGESATTDASGFYTFNLAPGSYTLTATAPGYSSESKQVSVSAGTTAWGSIMLAPAGAPTGTVKGYVFWGEQPSDYGTNVTDASKRLAGATLTFSPGSETATTDGGGFFQIDLPPDVYDVRAEAAGYTASNRPDPVTVTVGAVSWGSTMVLKAAASDSTPPDVHISRPADGSEIDLSPVQVEGTVADASAITALTVAGQPVSLQSGAFSTSVPLEPGENTLTVEATDAAGNVGQASVTVTYTATATGVFGFVFDGSQGETVRVVGAMVSVGDAQTLTDEAGAFEVEVPAGIYPFQVTAAGFHSDTDIVAVTEGAMTRVAAGLQPGQDADPTGTVVEITYPRDGEVLDSKRIQVMGTATGEDVARIEVNGVEAKRGGAEGAFSATVALPKGASTLKAIAYDAEGEILGSQSVSVQVARAGCSCTATVSKVPTLWSVGLLLGLGLLARRRR